jgi:hypothetical protein
MPRGIMLVVDLVLLGRELLHEVNARLDTTVRVPVDRFSACVVPQVVGVGSLLPDYPPLLLPREPLEELSILLTLNYSYVIIQCPAPYIVMG